LFGEAGNEEVEEPVAGCCGRLGQGTEAGLEEFLFMNVSRIREVSENVKLTELMTHGVPFHVGV
jgi:hypothetical protein